MLAKPLTKPLYNPLTRLSEGFTTLPSLVVGDPYWGNVVSLLHLDGVDGGTSIIDQKSRSWTVAGNAHIETDEFKFGSASLALDGSGDYIRASYSADFGFTTGDFTVEMWIFPLTIAGSDRAMSDFRATGGTGDGGTFFLDSTASGKLAFWDNTTKYGAVGSVPATSAWSHVALCRGSSTIYAFLNGVLQWSSAHTKNLGSASVMGIGGFAGTPTPPLGSSPFHGYIDEVRITKGVARYTSNFTPPTTPFPDF